MYTLGLPACAYQLEATHNKTVKPTVDLAGGMI